MKSKASKPTRAAKRTVERKAEYLDIRLAGTEKQTFKVAAEVAGLDLSAWVRSRLRTVARKELVEAQRNGVTVTAAKSVHSVASKQKTISARKSHAQNVWAKHDGLHVNDPYFTEVVKIMADRRKQRKAESDLLP